MDERLLFISISLSSRSCAYRVAQNFCGSLFLRIGDFLCFAGTNFLRSGQIGFSRWELIFAIFRKYPVTSIDNIFVFIEYVQ